MRKALLNYDSFTNMTESDERKKMDQPAYEKIYEGEYIMLTKEFEKLEKNNDLQKVLEERTSRRKFTKEKLTLEKLSYLLWYTYGVKAVLGNKRKATLRTVPSAGARHSLELYFIANNVEGLKDGLYHYNGVTHSIIMIKTLNDSRSEAMKIAANQEFVQDADVLFIFTCTPYRMEWRYPEVAVKYALIDAGHACENLYIAAASVGCGVCSIGAYYQDLADELLEINKDNKNDEVTVYMAALGNVE